MNYSTSVPIKYILTVLISNLFLIQISKAQNFIPDNKGYIADPKFRTIIAEHGYQIVASFDTLKTKPLVIGAHAMKDGKLIIIDTKGNVLPETTIPAYIYTTVSKSNSQGSPDIAIDAPLEDKNELFEQDNQNGKVGTRNKVTKKPGLPAVYDGLVWWGNGLISIKQGEKMGVARTNGTVLFAPTYRDISILQDFNKSKPVLYVVWDGSKFGLLNSSFKEIIAPKYGGIYACYNCDLGDNLLNVNMDSKRGLITRDGKEILAPVYDRIQNLTTNVLLIGAGGKMGLADTTGKILIQPAFEHITYNKENNFLELSNNFKMGIADKKGNIILQAVYDQIFPFNNGVAVVELNNKYGLADKNGKLIIEPAYDHLFYADNYLFAKKDGEYGLIDLKGNTLLPFKYSVMGYEKPGIFFKDGTSFGIMNISGKILVKLDYDDVDFKNGYLIVKKDGKYGVVNMKGKLLIPIKYDRIMDNRLFMHDGTIGAVLDGKNYLVDLYGDELAR